MLVVHICSFQTVFGETGQKGRGVPDPVQGNASRRRKDGSNGGSIKFSVTFAILRKNEYLLLKLWILFSIRDQGDHYRSMKISVVRSQMESWKRKGSLPFFTQVANLFYGFSDCGLTKKGWHGTKFCFVWTNHFWLFCLAMSLLSRFYKEKLMVVIITILQLTWFNMICIFLFAVFSSAAVGPAWGGRFAGVHPLAFWAWSDASGGGEVCGQPDLRRRHAPQRQGRRLQGRGAGRTYQATSRWSHALASKVLYILSFASYSIL